MNENEGEERGNERGKWEIIFTYFIKKRKNPKSSFSILKNKKNFHKLATTGYDIL